MQIKLLAEGGAMKPGPALSQKLGPAGINVNSVILKVNESTKEFKGMKVPVELDINTSTKEIKVRVFSPPVSELIKKELGIDKGSGAQKKTKVANASIEQMIKVAKVKSQNLLCNNLKNSVKTVVGSCVSLGILVENKEPYEVEREIEEGKYDKEIKNEISETPEKKKKELADFFSDLQNKQAQKAKIEAAAAAAAQQTATTTTPVVEVEKAKTPIAEISTATKKKEDKKGK